MSKSQRDKGAGYEREVCAKLSPVLGTVKRNLAQSRGGEGSDITVGPFAIECKRRAKIAAYEWMEQAERDAGDLVPMVIARGDGKQDIVIMYLTDALPMIAGEFNGA